MRTTILLASMLLTPSRCPATGPEPTPSSDGGGTTSTGTGNPIDACAIFRDCACGEGTCHWDCEDSYCADGGTPTAACTMCLDDTGINGCGSEQADCNAMNSR